MQEPDKMQHEIVAFVGECPVTVAAIPIASSNGMDDKPRFEVSKSEYLRLGKLLAAAPTLLAALEDLAFATAKVKTPIAVAALINARAAIAAARGESEVQS